MDRGLTSATVKVSRPADQPMSRGSEIAGLRPVLGSELL